MISAECGLLVQKSRPRNRPSLATRGRVVPPTLRLWKTLGGSRGAIPTPVWSHYTITNERRASFRPPSSRHNDAYRPMVKRVVRSGRPRVSESSSTSPATTSEARSTRSCSRRSTTRGSIFGTSVSSRGFDAFRKLRGAWSPPASEATCSRRRACSTGGGPRRTGGRASVTPREYRLR